MPLPNFIVSDVGGAISRGLKEGIFEDDLFRKPAAQIYDLDAYEANLKCCIEAFGEGFLHASAIKANAVSKMLLTVRDLGMGSECASIGEAIHTESLGFKGHKVVFDSPVKTGKELEYAFKHGYHTNIDNFDELAKAAPIYAALTAEEKANVGPIGVRINPLVGAGKIAMLSVSTAASKFGIPVNRKEEIIEAYRKHEFMTSLHIHVGSGRMGTSTLVAGIKVLVETAIEINKALGRQQITVLDIGGGMPCNVYSDGWDDKNENSPFFFEYADHLRKEVPLLFPTNPESPFKRIVTEFGQSLHGKAGQLVSQVEYVKEGADNSQIALMHFGADVCVRQVYTNEHNRRIEFYRVSESGAVERCETSEENKVSLAGPLCFQGDFIYRDIPGPKGGMKAGDFVVMKEAGHNTISIYSRHCSRLCLPVYGYRFAEDRKNVTEWVTLKEVESMESVCQFWGSNEVGAEYKKCW